MTGFSHERMSCWGSSAIDYEVDKHPFCLPIWGLSFYSDRCELKIRPISRTRRTLMKDDLPYAACFLPDRAAQAAAVDAACLVVLDAKVCRQHAIV
jgi:hypothetical protein